jgi:malate dehydrogenase (oxaloacetate-decarboxylating)
VKCIAPGFGAISLEDISRPRCFEIERRLKQELDIPVFHDDQHGTAVVILAGLINALKVVGKRMEDVRIVVCGLGAGGVATIRLLHYSGVRQIIGCDRTGILYRGRRKNMNPVKKEIAGLTNPEQIRGTVGRALQGADIFIGVSEARTVTVKDIQQMSRDAIIFAMANPVPEIMPEEAEPYARIIATGRPDYENQMSDILCFPGLFRGVFDCRAREINQEMLIAAANAIASCVVPEELMEQNIVPSVFNRKVPEAVARAVTEAALRTGVGTTEFKYSMFD